MNLLDPNLNEPVQFETLTQFSALHGCFEPGPMRELAVLGDPLRLNLGWHSWWDLAEWLGARDIACTVEGPFWTEWAIQPGVGRPNDSWCFDHTAEVQALVWIDGSDDIVRFERKLLQRFGRPERVEHWHRSGQNIKVECTSNVAEEILMKRIEHIVGPLPGQHLSQRLPG